MKSENLQTPISSLPSSVSTPWWYEAFPPAEYAGKPPGPGQMLYLVAYDVADPRRLSKVAKVCEDFGVRVQYSLFECRLKPEEFERLWGALEREIDPAEDRVVAYPLDARAARETRTAGTMVCSQQVVVYLV